jgi:hypothetical protein
LPISGRSSSAIARGSSKRAEPSGITRVEVPEKLQSGRHLKDEKFDAKAPRKCTSERMIVLIDRVLSTKDRGEDMVTTNELHVARRRPQMIECDHE